MRKTRVAGAALLAAGIAVAASLLAPYAGELAGSDYSGYVYGGVVDDGGFGALGAQTPGRLGEYASVEIEGVPVRLWSRSSLGIDGPFDVTACPQYGCEAMAPELVLAKLPYSPDAALLREQRARLASIVHVADLSDEELMLVAQYVRGD